MSSGRSSAGRAVSRSGIDEMPPPPLRCVWRSGVTGSSEEAALATSSAGAGSAWSNPMQARGAAGSGVVDPPAEGVVVVLPAGVGADGAGPALRRHMHRVLQADVQGHRIHMLGRAELLPRRVVAQQPAPVFLDVLGREHAQRRGLGRGCQPAGRGPELGSHPRGEVIGGKLDLT